jgi:BlaR1 peptidase M56
MPLLTQSALLRALGWSLFNSLWQMSLLWASFHLFLLVFNRLSARSRHGLALFLLTVGAGWSALTFLAAYSFPETVPRESQWLLTLIPAAVGGALSLISQWLISEALPWGSSIYLIMLSGLLLRYFRHYIRSRQITRKGLSRVSPAFKVFTTSTARQMGIRSRVGVYLSSLVDVPVTLGFLKPVILLPVIMVTHLRTEQVEAILVHELAHIQRKDYLLNLMVSAMELLFFFNPFTRMLIGGLKKEREHCCDERVLEFRYDPHSYVSALLSLARKNGREGLALAAIGGGDKLLLQRARKILQQKSQSNRPGPRSLFFLLLLLLLGAASLAVSIGLSVDPARSGSNAIILSGDRVLDIPRVHTSPTATRFGKAPLVAMAMAEDGGPVLIAPARRHITVHRVLRKLPAVLPEHKTMIVATIAGPDANTDTVSPKLKLAWLELMTEKEFRMQVMQLQAGLQSELGYLREQQANAQKAILVQLRTDAAPTIEPTAAMEQLLKEFLQRQLQLQQEYQNRMDELQRQWLKTGRRLTIVYI